MRIITNGFSVLQLLITLLLTSSSKRLTLVVSVLSDLLGTGPWGGAAAAGEAAAAEVVVWVAAMALTPEESANLTDTVAATNRESPCFGVGLVKTGALPGYSSCIVIMTKVRLVSVVWKVRRSVEEVDLTTGAPWRTNWSESFQKLFFHLMIFEKPVYDHVWSWNLI